MSKKGLVTILFFSVFVLQYLIHGAIFYLISVLYLLLAYILDKRSLRVLKKKHFWIFVAIIVVSYPLVMPGKDIYIFGIRLLSKTYLFVSIRMAVIGSVVFIWIAVLSHTLSPQDIAKFFKHLGLKGIGLYLSIAFNLIPSMEESIKTTYMAMRLKGGLGFSFLRWKLFAITVLRNVILMAENLSIALALEGIGDDLDHNG